MALGNSLALPLRPFSLHGGQNYRIHYMAKSMRTSKHFTHASHSTAAGIDCSSGNVSHKILESGRGFASIWPQEH